MALEIKVLEGDINIATVRNNPLLLIILPLEREFQDTFTLALDDPIVVAKNLKLKNNLFLLGFNNREDIIPSRFWVKNFPNRIFVHERN